MSARTKPPFRADHVGSLLRPKELLQARADRAAGRISAAELRRIEDQAIRKTVKMQEALACGRHRRRVSPHRLDHGFQIRARRREEAR
jgi:hypothetical protein